MQSAQDKVDATTRKFDEQVNRLIRDMSTMSKGTNAPSQQQQPQQSKPSQQQQPQQLGAIANPNNSSRQAAIIYIQNRQYEEAVQVAVTSGDQTLLMEVLRVVPTVQLFRPNVKQELLISLVQQITCGSLEDQLELKISYGIVFVYLFLHS